MNTQAEQMYSVVQLLHLMHYYWKYDLDQVMDFSGCLSAEDFEERQAHDPAACQQLQAAVWPIVTLVLA